MRVAVVGAGSLGQAVGGLLAAAGHQVIMTWSRTEAALRAAADNVGHGALHAGAASAVRMADAVVFAPRFEHVEAAARAGAPWADTLVLDATNPFTPERDGVVDLGTENAAQYVHRHLAGARYVKTFNTVTAEGLRAAAGRTGDARIALLLSGDDLPAKHDAARLVHDAGFDAADLGGLDSSSQQLPGGQYFGREITLADVSPLPAL